MEAFFSLRGGATEAIVREIGSARQEIQVQAYSFTSEAIAKALIEAKKRGVKIEVDLDQSNATARYSAATEGDHNRFDLMKWGLVPFWAKDPSIGSQMINARSETVREKPAFRQAIK